MLNMYSRMADIMSINLNPPIDYYSHALTMIKNRRHIKARRKKHGR